VARYGIIKNKYLVFSPGSCHRASRILGIYCLLYTNELTPIWETRQLQVLVVKPTSENQPLVIRGLEFSAHSPIQWPGEGLDIFSHQWPMT